MPRCTVCDHPKRREIDSLLATGRTKQRDIAERYGVTPQSLSRHKRKDLWPSLARRAQQRDANVKDTLLAKLDGYLNLLDAAIEEANTMELVALIREARGLIAVQLEAHGELNQPGTINVLVMPEWADLRGRIISALAPYPEARAAVAVAIQEGESDGTAHQRPALPSGATVSVDPRGA